MPRVLTRPEEAAHANTPRSTAAQGDHGFADGQHGHFHRPVTRGAAATRASYSGVIFNCWASCCWDPNAQKKNNGLPIARRMKAKVRFVPLKLDALDSALFRYQPVPDAMGIVSHRYVRFFPEIAPIERHPLP